MAFYSFSTFIAVRLSRRRPETAERKKKKWDGRAWIAAEKNPRAEIDLRRNQMRKKIYFLKNGGKKRRNGGYINVTNLWRKSEERKERCVIRITTSDQLSCVPLTTCPYPIRKYTRKAAAADWKKRKVSDRFLSNKLGRPGGRGNVVTHGLLYCTTQRRRWGPGPATMDTLAITIKEARRKKKEKSRGEEEENFLHPHQISTAHLLSFLGCFFFSSFSSSSLSTVSEGHIFVRQFLLFPFSLRISSSMSPSPTLWPLLGGHILSVVDHARQLAVLVEMPFVRNRVECCGRPWMRERRSWKDAVHRADSRRFLRRRQREEKM